MFGLLVFMVLFSGGFVVTRGLLNVERATGPVQFDRFGGPELVLLFFASSTCGACNDKRLLAAYPAMIENVAKEALERKVRFATAGVGIDHRPSDAIKFFNKFGPFNELIIGRNWTNSGALRYLWGEFSGAPETPQVVVVARTLSDSSNWVVQVKSERVLLRLSGLRQILRWINAGAPIPTYALE